MGSWDRVVSTVGAGRVVAALGLLFAVGGVGRAIRVAAEGGEPVEFASSILLVGIPGLLISYGGYRLPTTGLHPDTYPRIVAWLLGGFGLLLGVVGLRVLSPGVTIDEPFWSATLAAAMGSVAGLAIGMNEARAVSRAREAERHNRELVRFERLIEEATDVNAVLDPQGRFHYLTPSVEHVLGYEPDELVGEIAFEYMHPADREAAMEGFAEAVEEGRGGPVEFRFRHADGSWVVLAGRGRNLLDDPAIEGIVAYTHDVTERKAHERDLQQYKTVAETASDVIVRIDERSTIRSVNPAVEDVFGYEPDELVGESLTTLMPERMRDRHRDSLEGYLRTGERTLDWKYIELPGLHADGHEVPLAVSFNEYEFDGDRFFTGIIRDNTERKRLEDDLRATKERYRQLVEQNLVGIYLLQDGEIEYANPTFAEIFGYETEESLLGTDPLEYVAPEDREMVAEHLRAREEGEVDSIEYTFTGVRKDGERIELEVYAGRVEYEGEPAILGAMNDVTERERMEAELRRERDLRERIFETSPIGIAVRDRSGTFTFLNDRGEQLLGRTREELNDLSRLAEVFDAVDDAGADVSPDDTPFGQIVEGGEPVFDVDLRLTRPDGSRLWVSVNGAPLVDQEGEAERVVLTFEDVTERKRYQDRLVLLNELSQELTDAETDRAVGDLVLQAASDTLGLPLLSVELYDEKRGGLRPVTRSPAVTERVGGGPLFEGEQDLCWQAFVEQTQIVYDDLLAETDVSTADTALRSTIVTPLGEHGVLVVGATTPAAFADTDVSVAQMLAANTRSALDRVDRERTLRDRTEQLAEQNAALERVQRLNEIIRGITEELIEASTREEIVQAVCDRLATADAYRFAWVGTHDAVTDEVVPEARAGVEDGYLDSVTVTTDESDQEPTARAVRARETRVQNDLSSDPPYEPWRKAALDRGYQASIAVPLVYQDTLYGVIGLYADQSGVFDRMEETVLAELGEIIGFALNALERKQALVGEQSVELKLQLRKGEPPLSRFVDEHGCEFEFENIVQRADGPPGIFVTVRGVPPADVLEFGERSPDIEELSLVSDGDDGAMFECRLRDSAFFSAILDRGGMPQTMVATGEEGYAVVRIPRTSDIRTFVELFEAHHEEVELVGRREVEQPIKTQQEFEAEFRTRLTERQEEVLQRAYVSGFFDWPRQVSAQDLADSLGVSQPTVSRHIRAGERALFGLVFDEA